MSQAPYVLQLLRLQPTASTLHFMRGQYSSSVGLDGIPLDFRQVCWLGMVGQFHTSYLPFHDCCIPSLVDVSAECMRSI